MRALWQDVRFGFRMLRKRPGFTAVALITLAIGIGADTIMFSIADVLLLRPQGVEDPEQLAYCGIRGQRFSSFRYSAYRTLIQDYTTALWQQLAGIQGKVQADLEQVGDLVAVTLVERSIEDGVCDYRYIAEFKRARILLHVVYDSRNKVAVLDTDANEIKTVADG